MKLSVINESIEDIDANKLLTLWYEDEDGNVIPCDPKILEPPKGAVYQLSQFPNMLKTTCLKLMNDGSSKEVFSGESSWPEDLALAMANTGKYKLSQAILIAAQSCERCLNSLLHKYNLGGYPEYSEEWKKSGTICGFCNDPSNIKQE